MHHLGATSDGIKLAKVCGTTKYSRRSYLSSSNVITMQFTSGPMGSGPGFLAVIETGIVIKTIRTHSSFSQTSMVIKPDTDVKVQNSDK